MSTMTSSFPTVKPATDPRATHAVLTGNASVRPRIDGPGLTTEEVSALNAAYEFGRVRALAAGSTSGQSYIRGGESARCAMQALLAIRTVATQESTENDRLTFAEIRECDREYLAAHDEAVLNGATLDRARTVADRQATVHRDYLISLRDAQDDATPFEPAEADRSWFAAECEV